MTVAASVRRSPTAGPLRNPLFLGWLGGHGISLVGDQMYFLAFAWAAARLDDPFLTSLAVGAGSTPRALLLLFGGALADRVGLRRVMLVADALRLVVMAVAAAASGLSGTPLALLVTVAVVFGVVDAAYLPAARAFPTQLLPAEQLPKAAGMRQLIDRAAGMAGAPLGALAVATGGFTLACVVNALSFAVSLAILWRLRPVAPPPPPARGSLLADTWTGLRYVAGVPLLRAVLLGATAVEFSITGAVTVGVALRAAGEGWGVAGQGWVVGALAAGAGVGAAVATLVKSWPRPGVTLFVATALQGGCVAAIGLGELPVAVAAAAALGVLAGIASALYGGLVMANTAAAYQGRVAALTTFQSQGLTPVAFALFGLAVSQFGLTAAFVGCGVLELLASGVAFVSPAVRRASFARS